MYINYLIVRDYSFEGLAFIINIFLIINIVFHGVSISRILKILFFSAQTSLVKHSFYLHQAEDNLFVSLYNSTPLLLSAKQKISININYVEYFHGFDKYI